MSKTIQEHACSECGHMHKPLEAKKLGLDGQKLAMLQHAARLVQRTGSNRFTRAELDLGDQYGRSAYSNWATIRRFGLIAEGDRRKTWLITPYGWAFLRGKRKVKSWIMVRDGHVRHELGYGPELLINQLKGGVEPIQTTFEYFDDDNRPVGVRPTAVRESLRQRLI